MRILGLFLVILLATSVFTALAFVYHQQTQSISQTIKNVPYWYVDNNTSDVDSDTDRGTHSNFTAQQSGPDAIHDSLTEEQSLVWLSGWGKRVKVTIDHNDIISGLSSFPVLLHLSSSSGRGNDDVTSVFDELQNDNNRKKIAVTTVESGTQCYVEIEEWDDANEQAWLWVKVPSVSSTSDTALYLYYDRNNADNTLYVGDTGSAAAQNVWDPNFKGVWHLGETSGGAGAIEDSTINNNAGTDYGSPILGTAGQIGNAIAFDGFDDYISIPNSASLQFTTSLTIEGWVRLNSFGSGTDVDIILRKGEGNPNDYQLAVHDQLLTLMIEENDDQGVAGATVLSANTLYYVSGTWNGSTRSVYLDGFADGSGSKTGSIAPDTRAIYIGGRSGTDLSNGTIDEVRVSNTARNDAWLKASYESGKDDLLDFGDEEHLNTHSLDATGGYMIVGDGTPDWGSTTGTISFWTKMDTSVQGRFWGQDDNMETRWSGTNLVLDWGATGSMTSATSFSADTWYFVAVVWDENNDNLFLYIGDESTPPTLDSNSLSGTWTSITPLPTENRFMNGLGGNEPLDGHGDDLRYWNIARSLAEIQNDYNKELVGSEPSLRSYFRLNNNFDDIGPDNNDGSGSGSYSFSTDVPFTATNYMLDLEVQWINVDYSEANEELCIYFYEEDAGSNNTHSLDATGGYMLVGDGTPDWGSTTGTISFWMKWDTVANRPWGQHENMETRFSGLNLVVDWGIAGSITSSTSFTADNWYFVAIVWNENTDDLYLYVGDEDNPPALDTYNNAWTDTVSDEGITQNNFMASKGGVDPTDGHGDDLRYYTIDRSLAEIQSDYKVELSGSETNLRSYFKLNNDFDDIGPDNNDGSGSGGYSFSTDTPFSIPATENVRVDAWTGAAWQNLFTNLNNGWNNVTISSYLTSSTFTIRFGGSLETNDTSQDSWEIDASLLHVWT